MPSSKTRYRVSPDLSASRPTLFPSRLAETSRAPRYHGSVERPSRTMSARAIRHSVIVAPSSRALSWRAMVSASGSSGMASVPLRTQLADEANGAFQVGERRRPRPAHGDLLERVLIRHPLDQAQVGDDHRHRSSHARPTTHHQAVLLLVLLKPLDRFTH